jgi:hypothetical protein
MLLNISPSPCDGSAPRPSLHLFHPRSHIVRQVLVLSPGYVHLVHFPFIYLFISPSPSPRRGRFFWPLVSSHWSIFHAVFYFPFGPRPARQKGTTEKCSRAQGESKSKEPKGRVRGRKALLFARSRPIGWLFIALFPFSFPVCFFLLQDARGAGTRKH